MGNILHTKQAPAAVGPYVQGVDIGNLIFTSGQIPLDPATGELAVGIKAQTLQALINVKAIVEAAGLTASDIVKVTLFVKNMQEFSQVNKVYGDFFDKYAHAYPARSCIEAASLPKGALIEIEAIALRK